MINKNSSHPELDSGSRCSIKAFTLIELLVVVLIIGILTAVAMPMYKRAVLKSRFSTLMPLAKNLWDSNEVFYLSNGGYAAGVDELDVSASAAPNVQAEVKDEENHQYVRVSNPNIPNRLTMYQKHSPNFAGETHCEALLNDNLANWLCKDSLQGTFVGNKFGYAVYTLSPEAVGSLARTYYNTTGEFFSEGDTCIATSGSGCRYMSPSAGSHCITTATAGARACGGLRGTNHTTCEGNSRSACEDGHFDDHSSCIGNVSSSCDGVYMWTYSTCEGNSAGACNVKYMVNHSTCYGNVSGSCNSGANHWSYNNSSCMGEASNTCTGGKFNNNSTCVANAVGACTGTTYDATSYCSGNYCPSGAASNTAGKVWYRGEGEEWPDTRASILVDKE